jgi:hypothetical protein
MAARRDHVDVTNDSKNDEIEIAIRVHSLVTIARNIDGAMGEGHAFPLNPSLPNRRTILFRSWLAAGVADQADRVDSASKRRNLNLTPVASLPSIDWHSGGEGRRGDEAIAGAVYRRRGGLCHRRHHPAAVGGPGNLQVR